HGRSLPQNRVAAVGVRTQEFGSEPQGLIGGMTHPEHPLVPAHRADAAPDLIRERLKGEPMVGSRQGARQRVTRALGSLCGEKLVDCFLETAPQEMFAAFERN